jgi:tRNA(Ile)-lysidine synthase
MGPHPAVAAVRSAVRHALPDLDPGAVVLVACSGGADSVALAAATAFEGARAGWSPAGLTIDHGLQPGSAERASRVAALLRLLGLDPVEVVTVTVAGPGGPEAAARRARYASIDEVAGRLSAATVLLGHTRDDQAETVLLGLARGSGARSLAGMPGVARSALTRGVVYRRPLLGLDRAVTRAACAAEGLDVWDDPHNADPAYARSRVRHRVLPVLERELGPGVPAALARSADLLRDDADALDAWADRAYADCTSTECGNRSSATRSDTDGLADESSYADSTVSASSQGVGSAEGGSEDGGRVARTPEATSSTGSGAASLWVDRLLAVPPAVRRRVLRRGALWAGCPATDLTAGHVSALESLVVSWRGQAWVDLPGSVRAARREGRICFSRSTARTP